MENNYNKSFTWILNDQYRVVYHLVFWIFVYADELFSYVGLTYPLDLSVMGFFLVVFGDLSLVYLTLYIFLPWFFNNKSRRFFTAIIIGLSLVSVFNIWLLNSSPFLSPCSECESSSARDFIVDFILISMSTALILGTACGVRIMKEFLRKEIKMRALQKSNFENELAYLKEQINPHFLFNALNNIYVQSRKRPKDAPDSILLLSDMLRYQLYDSSHNQVRLEDEIEYLRNYLKLDEMRKTDTVVNFEIIGDPKGKLVAPFLFIPYLENAIKHGGKNETKDFLNVKFNITEEKIIYSVTNSKPTIVSPHQVGGIGLPNLQRRLDLLYPEMHIYSVKETANTYMVILELQIK